MLLEHTFMEERSDFSNVTLNKFGYFHFASSPVPGLYAFPRELKLYCGTGTGRLPFSVSVVLSNDDQIVFDDYCETRISMVERIFVH